MDRDLVIDRSPGETRVALLEEGRVAEIHHYRAARRSLLDNIYLGRVARVLPGLDAAFVEIGEGAAGFLAAAEAVAPATRADINSAAPRISSAVTEGEAVIVQVRRDAIDGKSPRLTRRIGLPGRRLVFRPGQSGVSMARRIDDPAERARLAALGQAIAGAEEAFILRSAAVGASAEELAGEADRLRALWAGIESKSANAGPPAALYIGTDPVARALRDYVGEGSGRIRTGNRSVYKKAADYCDAFAPELKSRLEWHRDQSPLFEALEIEAEIEAALVPTVPLPSGGRMTIERTAALVAVDVDTGTHLGAGAVEQAILETNLEAAAEMARQLRLRNLGGLVVIDFVSMRADDHRRRVLAALGSAVKRDPAPVEIGGFTALGLVELTRRHQRESLDSVVADGCPLCDGVGHIKAPLTLGLDILRRVLREARVGSGKKMIVTAAPAVIACLDGDLAAAADEAREALGGRLVFLADPASGAERYDLRFE